MRVSCPGNVVDSQEAKTDRQQGRERPGALPARRTEEGMEADDLLCSRNTRPEKGRRGVARCPSCSQNAHDETVLVRCAQWGTYPSHPGGNVMEEVHDGA